MHAFAQHTSELVGRIAQRQRETSGEVRRLRSDLDRLRREVDEMTKADEIAAAVTAAQRRDRSQRFGFWHKLAGGVAAAILLVPAVHDLALWLSG